MAASRIKGNNSMSNPAGQKKILLFDESQETRDELETMLKRDGYKVLPARDEEEAIERAEASVPDLILVSLTGTSTRIVNAARRIRAQSNLGCRVPVVIFSSSITPEGEEWEIDGNIHITAPDSSTQLRMLLRRVVREISQKL
jgi:DNA-binding response OmpR family regulator